MKWIRGGYLVSECVQLVGLPGFPPRKGGICADGIIREIQRGRREETRSDHTEFPRGLEDIVGVVSRDGREPVRACH